MMFTLGLIVGLLIAVLIAVTLLLFRRVIEQKLTIVEKQIAAKGPKPKGFIVEPLDETTELRNEVIDRNRKAGKDTHISELID